MIDYRNINASEGGLSVRAKINSMFAALISGDEGVNNVWKKLVEVTNGFNSLELSVDDMYDELKEQVLKSFDYTDVTAEDLRTYINGMNGGISGFAVDTSFNPDFPEDKAATVLAVGAGTYVNMLDVNGDPITIEDADALTVFYKGANSTYWQYKSTYARVVLNEIVQETGSNENAVMSQKATTEVALELIKRIRGTLDSSSAMTDPFLFIGNFTTAKEFNVYLDAKITQDSDSIIKHEGRCKALINGINVEVYNFVSNIANKNITQVVFGSVGIDSSGSVEMNTPNSDNNFNIITRCFINGVATKWAIYCRKEIKELKDATDTEIAQIKDNATAIGNLINANYLDLKGNVAKIDNRITSEKAYLEKKIDDNATEDSIKFNKIEEDFTDINIVLEKLQSQVDELRKQIGQGGGGVSSADIEMLKSLLTLNQTDE